MPSTSHVLIEPHQKHIVGQSDLETALHTLLDHIREPFLALKSNTAIFTHVFGRSPAHKSLRTHAFAPRIDMRETAQAYHIDIELPGLHDASALTIDWRSDRELLVEGSLERPSINTRKLLDRMKEARDVEEGVAGGDQTPSYVLADKARGFEPNEDLNPPASLGSTTQNGAAREDTAPSYVVEDQANAVGPNEDFYPSDDVRRTPLEEVVSEDPTTRPKMPPFIMSESHSFDSNDRIFPLDIVDGRQLDEGDMHRVKVPMQRMSATATAPSITVGERDVGRFMRCFVFPSRVEVDGLRTEMVDGLLRIDVPKLGEEIEWGYDLSRVD